PVHGGHAATSLLLQRLGRISRFIPWSPENHSFDIKRIREECRRYKPAMILLDLGATLFPLPVGMLRAAVGQKCIIAYDASHTMGLIAGDRFPNPLDEGANVLFGNTHKSFPGPQKAMIHFVDEALAKRARTMIGKAFVSSQHTGDSIALYMTILEMQMFGRQYASAMIANALQLASSLENMGFSVLKRGGITTESSVFWVIPPKGMTSNDLCRQLMICGIYTNARNLHGIGLLRVGTQYVTRQGMGKPAMDQIAYLWKRAVDSKGDGREVRDDVSEFMRQFTKIEYSFDRFI